MPRVVTDPAVPDTESLDNEIARLRGLDVGGLRARWHTVFRRRAPTHLKTGLEDYLSVRMASSSLARHCWQFKTYASLRPACLRSAYAAHTPIPIKIHMASERDGWPGSPLLATAHKNQKCAPRFAVSFANENPALIPPASRP